MIITTRVHDPDLQRHARRSEEIFKELVQPGIAGFGEMAAALRVQAHDLAYQLDYTGELLGELDARWTGIRKELMELHSRARMVGCAHNFLKDLSRADDEMRLLLFRQASTVT